MNELRNFAAACVAMLAILGAVAILAGGTTDEVIPTTTTAYPWACHDVGPYTEDALPGNLSQMGVAFYLEPGHNRLCVAPEVGAIVAAERAAIVAAGGWGG